MPLSDREIVRFQFGPSLGKIPFEYREAGDSFEVKFIGKEEWHKLDDLLVPVEEKDIDFLQHVRVNGAEWLVRYEAVSDKFFEPRDASVLWETELGRRLTSLVRTFLKEPEDNTDSEVRSGWSKEADRKRMALRVAEISEQEDPYTLLNVNTFASVNRSIFSVHAKKKTCNFDD